MIPVLAVPILNRGDLLLRLVRSIDYPVNRLVIVNNGRDPKVDQYMNDLVEYGPDGDCIESVVVRNQPDNLGVSGSWNFIMREYSAPYWLIVGNDIRFTRGDLAKFDAFMKEGKANLAFGNQGYSAFAITPRAVELAGTFDGNLFPAYHEDQDYSRRCHLSGVSMADIPDTHMLHGDAPQYGSSTIYSNPSFRKANETTHEWNTEYYIAKWGGLPGAETAEHPFGRKNWPVSKWELDKSRIDRARALWNQ